VGVGQDEIEVVAHAHTCLVVTVPGLGDEVQALKAGILEVADLLVVNKADREGADQTVHDLESMLAMRLEPSRAVPVIKTAATTGLGVAELAEAAESPPHRGARSPQF
jgi:LAO/AO transport system kinase